MVCAIWLMLKLGSAKWHMSDGWMLVSFKGLVCNIWIDLSFLSICLSVCLHLSFNKTMKKNVGEKASLGKIKLSC